MIGVLPPRKRAVFLHEAGERGAGFEERTIALSQNQLSAPEVIDMRLSSAVTAIPGRKVRGALEKAASPGSFWALTRSVMVLLAIAALLLLGGPSCSEPERNRSGPPEEPAATPESPPSEEIPGLSVEQARMVSQHGYPDHFFLSLDPTTGDRMERWTYFSLRKTYDFYNGRLSGEESVEDESQSYPSTDLRPQDFTPSTTPQELEATLGKPLLRHELRSSLQAPNLMLVYPQAVFLFRDGRLMGMDTKVNPPSLLEGSGSR